MKSTNEQQFKHGDRVVISNVRHDGHYWNGVTGVVIRTDEDGKALVLHTASELEKVRVALGLRKIESSHDFWWNPDELSLLDADCYQKQPMPMSTTTHERDL